MKTVRPHYLLFTESQLDDFDEQRRSGFWRFIIQSASDKTSRFEAVDREFRQSEHRLELLAVIRGLEYLERPSTITLVTASRYVRHGFRRGLKQWSANQWQWERFGEMIPIKNADLWQRINRALQYHNVECRYWRFDAPELPESVPVRRPNFLNRPKVQFEFEPDASSELVGESTENQAGSFFGTLSAKVAPLVKMTGMSK